MENIYTSWTWNIWSKIPADVAKIIKNLKILLRSSKLRECMGRRWGNGNYWNRHGGAEPATVNTGPQQLPNLIVVIPLLGMHLFCGWALDGFTPKYNPSATNSWAMRVPWWDSDLFTLAINSSSTFIYLSNNKRSVMQQRKWTIELVCELKCRRNKRSLV
jgi:hypothetical protein